MTWSSRDLRLGLVALLLTAPAVCSVTARAQSDVAFSPDVYAARRERLLSRTHGAAVVIAGRYLINPGDELTKQDPDFWYLTGVESPYAILVVTASRDGRAVATLFLPAPLQFAGGQFPMDEPAFRSAPWNRPRQRLAPGDAARRATGVDATYPLADFAERVRSLLGDSPVVYTPEGETLFAPAGLAAPADMRRQFRTALQPLVPRAELRDLSPLVEALRLIKDRHEIEALRQAAVISGRGMIEGMRATRAGMNDRELAGLMEYVWKREGSTRSAFPPIVASGEHAMTFFTLLREQYNAVDRVMKDGDLVFVDYGAAEFRTYTTDLCRTWPVSGKFSPLQRRYYDIVLEAQEAAIAAIRPDVLMLDVIKAAARVFERHGLERYEDIAIMGADRVWGIMPSPTHYLARDAGIVRYNSFGRGVRDLGHHIGLEVQDSRDYSMPLAPGMVVTIEPKLYIPELNVAIMIEDMILVTESGHENLSAALPKRAREIEQVMSNGRRANAWRPAGVRPHTASPAARRAPPIR